MDFPTANFAEQIRTIKTALSKTCFAVEVSGLLYDDTGTFNWVTS